MTEEVKRLMTVADQAKISYYQGYISYEEAKVKIMPYIKAVNKKSKEIAKKYNMKPRLVSMGDYMRFRW